MLAYRRRNFHERSLIIRGIPERGATGREDRNPIVLIPPVKDQSERKVKTAVPRQLQNTGADAPKGRRQT